MRSDISIEKYKYNQTVGNLIHMRPIFLSVSLLFSMILCPVLSARQPNNVILVLIDDLGWMDLGCYGSTYYHTPNLDQFAGDGMRFTQAYSAHPTCSPTRASIHSGQYPARIGMTSFIPGVIRQHSKLNPPEGWFKYLKMSPWSENTDNQQDV